MRLVLLLAILSLIAGCQQTSASLRDEAEALLQVPESTQLATGGYDARQTVEGHLAALVRSQYGTDESWDDVVSGLPSTDEWAVMAWHSDNRILRLGHLRDERAVKHERQFVTIYDVALIGKGLAPQCPERRTPAVPPPT